MVRSATWGTTMERASFWTSGPLSSSCWRVRPTPARNLTQAESEGKKQVDTVVLSDARALMPRREREREREGAGKEEVSSRWNRKARAGGRRNNAPPAMATWKVVESRGVVRSQVLMLRPTWTGWKEGDSRGRVRDEAGARPGPPLVRQQRDT